MKYYLNVPLALAALFQASFAWLVFVDHEGQLSVDWLRDREGTAPLDGMNRFGS